MSLELKWKKVQASVGGVTPRNDLHGDSFQTAVTVNVAFLADPTFLDQLSGETVGVMGFREWFWKDHGGMYVTGLAPLKWLTEFTYHRIRFRIGDSNTTIASSKIDGISAEPQENAQVKIKLKLKFECAKTFIGDLSEQINRPTGVGLTFMGENEAVRDAAENQGELDMDPDPDNVTNIEDAKGDGAE